MMSFEQQRDFKERTIELDDYVMITVDWVRNDAAMRRDGQTKPVWTGEMDLPELGDIVIVWPGCTSGMVVEYSIKRGMREWERAVWVKLDGGELLKLYGSELMSMTKKRKEFIIEQNASFRKRLIAADKKVVSQRKERRAKIVKGSHLVDIMLAAADGLDVKETSAYYKIGGADPKLRVYLLKKGGRVDLNGFCVDHRAVIAISEAEAQSRHIGRVRGQIDFSHSDATIMEAFNEALAVLRS